MAKQYVSDLIGDEYKSWKEGDYVIIATPTGSGKTTFVVSKLLKEAMSHGKHVVYYCNRKVLHDQFEVQSKSLIELVFGKEFELAEDAVNYLHIFTYQGAELSHCYPNARYKPEIIPAMDRKLGGGPGEMKIILHCPEQSVEKEIMCADIMFYIYDEAHYFISDAQIRYDTNYWYHNNLKHGISVFLTATPKPLLCFLGKPPLENNYSQVNSMLSNRKIVEEYYPHIENQILDLLNSWKRYDSVNFDIMVPHSLQRAFMRRWPEPIAPLLGYIREIYNNAPDRSHYYRTEPDYSYIDAKYFCDDEVLLDQIGRTGDDKWIIFVDSEAYGVDLLQAIEAQGLGTAALLSSRRIKRDNSAKFVYHMIVETQQFPCRILISTSALDCGINIIDPEVKHMAIYCDNETTFLQMLGRKRVVEGERLQLYIAHYPYCKIQTRYNQCLDALKFMMQVAMKNQLDPSTRKFYLSKTQMRNLNRDISSDKYHNLFYCLDEDGQQEYGHLLQVYTNVSNVDQYLHGITYSKTAMLHILCKLYDYRTAMDRYRRESGLGIKLADFIYHFYKGTIDSAYSFDNCVSYYRLNKDLLSRWNKFVVWWNEIKSMEPKDGVLHFDLKVERDNFFYLKYQLGWLGKEYDPSCWLLGSEKRLKLIDFLENAVGSELCQDEHHSEQRDFSLQCIKLMLDLPLPPKNLHRNKSRYGPKKWPGINVLNKWLNELKLPYFVDHDQKNKVDGKYKTRWIIKRAKTGETQSE